MTNNTARWHIYYQKRDRRTRRENFSHRRVRIQRDGISIVRNRFPFLLGQVCYVLGTLRLQHEVQIQSKTAKMRRDEEQRTREQRRKRLLRGKARILHMYCMRFGGSLELREQGQEVVTYWVLGPYRTLSQQSAATREHATDER